MSGIGLLLQLVFGFAVVLAPGVVVARALGVRRVSAAVGWSLTLVFAGLALTFALGLSLTFTLALLLAAGVVALPAGLRRWAKAPPVPWRWPVLGAGVLLGLLLWRVAGHVGGDGFFHLARVQKLLAFGDLSLDAANEFPDGGLHPGYAFPLWHGFLALVAKVSFADPVDVVVHGPTVLAPIAVVVAFEAGWALFRHPVPAAASAAAGVAVVAMAPGHGGALTALALPATGSRQLLVPAALALALEATRHPTRSLLASATAASFVLAVVHPTYALFLWIPFVGFIAVRWLWERRDARAGGLALAALVVPAAIFFAWLLPVINDTESVSPDEAERDRAFDQYAGQLDGTPDSFAVVPELFGRTGAVAVAGLLLLPLAGLAARRRWAAYVVGGSLAVFAICLVPWLFTPFADVVSLSQARRLAGYLPLAFALAGGIGVLARLIGVAVLPVALAAGIVLQLAYPGDFGYTLEDGGPAWATWVAVVGAIVALFVGLRRRPPLERTAALAAALLLLPTYRPRLLELVALGGTCREPAVGRPGRRGAGPRSRTGRPSTPTPRRATASARSRPSASASIRRATSRTRSTTGRASGSGSSAASRGPATSRSRARCGATWLVVDLERFPELAPDDAVYRDERWVLAPLDSA